jgi:leucyl aminopeptidase
VQLALVGKGITFDAGGTSLKAAPGMAAMKADMSGGAAVINAVLAAAELHSPTSLIAVVPLTENMPGGGASRPGDVVRTMNGRTIEINNTDAEGRLVLSDALSYAVSLGATHIVDVATLTGSDALGHVTSGVMTNNRPLLDCVRIAADQSGERVWELPLLPEQLGMLKSDVADYRNYPDTRAAGTINGGVLLREFVGGRPWVHIDIAATAWNDEVRLYPSVPQGPSGAMTRTLATLPFVLTEG